MSNMPNFRIPASSILTNRSFCGIIFLRIYLQLIAIKEARAMNLNQTAAKVYDTIFFFIEYFNPKEIENNFINAYDDASFMTSCYDQVKSEIGSIPNYMSPLFLYLNDASSPMSQFYSEHFDLDNENIDSFIVKLITDSDKLKTKVYEQIFGNSESGNYIDALETLDAPAEYKLRVSMLFGDFDHAIKVLTPILKQVYLSVDKLNKKYEREIMSRFEQIQSAANIRTYQNFLKYDDSRFDSTEISICLLNQYIVYSEDKGKEFLMMLGYKHEESIEKQSDDIDSISTEQFILCCSNELRLKIIRALCEHEELTASQLAQILDCPVTTMIRHINMLGSNNLIFLSKRDGLQIFYKLNLKLFKIMRERINNLFNAILQRKD